MDKLKKKKKLNLENAHTYLPPQDCAACSVCAFVPMGEALLVALVTMIN